MPLRIALLLGAVLCASAATPPRVLLVSGGHDHELSFYEMFSAEPAFTYNVNPHPKAFRPNMVKQYDVAVLYDSADVTDEAERANLRRFLEAGKGLVLLHHSIVDNQDWPWWYEEVAGGLYQLKAVPGRPASKYKHDVEMNVRPVGRHPVIEGIGPFKILDEAYKDVWMSPKVQVLLETDNPLNDKPLAWVSPYPKSRVVYIQLGHGSDAHRHPVYRKLLRNAIFWAAGSK
jgi:type 1 glutamine amidotransferase